METSPSQFGRQFGQCPACDSSSAQLLFTAGDRRWCTTDRLFQIVECCDCRLIRLYPQPAPPELASYYPADYWKPLEHDLDDWLRQKYRRLVLSDRVHFVERSWSESTESESAEAEAAELTSGKRGILLDVGCGDGFLLSILAGRGRRHVVGLDFSLDAATSAWRDHPSPSFAARFPALLLPMKAAVSSLCFMSYSTYIIPWITWTPRTASCRRRAA